MFSVCVTATAETEEQAERMLSDMEEAVGKNNGDLIEGDIADEGGNYVED